MGVTKKDFGRFVAERRRREGLTQRALAERLHVTESAVSKWERGLSYPDVTLVASLADELGVAANELIDASEDQDRRRDMRDARVLRQWRSAIIWSTAITYAVALLACFVVNLSVTHTLSWFWIVVAAVALAFSLTTLPLLPAGRSGWVVLGAATLSLLVLLLVIWLLHGQGTWLPIAVSAVLFAELMVFGPVWLWTTPVPQPWSRHRLLIVLIVDTVALALLLLIILACVGHADAWPSPALLLAAVGAVPVWVVALVLRYLPVAELYRAALAVMIAGVCGWFADPTIARILGQPFTRTVDLVEWRPDAISGNVNLLLLCGALLAAIVLAVVQITRSRGRRDRPGAGTSRYASAACTSPSRR